MINLPWSDPVFLVHGIRDTAGDGRDDDWYREMRSALWPFFRCIEIRYREFHQPLTGAIKLFLWPWGLVLLAACAAVALGWTWLVGVLVAFPLSAIILDDIRWNNRWPNRYEVLLVVLSLLSLGVIAGMAWWLVNNQWAAVVLLFGVAGFIALQEWREYVHNGRPLAWLWSSYLLFLMPLVGTALVLWPGPTFPAISVLFTVVSLVEPNWRRARAAEQVARQVRANLTDRYLRPSVIAHSLGTVLTRIVLRQLEPRRWRRFVFVGSPLRQETSWHPFLGSDSVYLEAIYNEAARKDVFVRIAGLLEPLLGWWTGLGGAGYAGFRCHRLEQNLLIHNIEALLGPCPVCLDGSLLADIHNVAVTEGLHSKALLTDDHARGIWLPFLWGFAPNAYEQFIQSCRQGYNYLLIRDHFGVARVMQEVGRFRGLWRPYSLEQLTLLEYAEEILRAKLERQPALRETSFWSRYSTLYIRLFELLFRAIYLGVREEAKPAREKILGRLGLLCPQVALGAVLDQMCREIRSRVLP